MSQRRFSPEVILSVIEARLDHQRPADALGIPEHATVDQACTAYSALLRELAQFHGHPTYGARSLLAAKRSRYALLAFTKGWRDDYPSVGTTRSR
jgi:hypothetical protein